MKVHKKAFPHPNAIQNQGMDLRDWFAGNAPEVPDWFKSSKISGSPKHPGFFAERFGSASTHMYKQYASYYDEGKFLSSAIPKEFIEEVNQWENEMESYRKAHEEFEQRQNMKRLSEWRFAYADAMMKERGSEMELSPR